jgi:hypothetical protein
MQGTDGTPPTEGQRALAISNAIARLHHEHYGRGPDSTRTIIQGDYVSSTASTPRSNAP